MSIAGPLAKLPLVDSLRDDGKIALNRAFLLPSSLRSQGGSPIASLNLFQIHLYINLQILVL